MKIVKEFTCLNYVGLLQRLSENGQLSCLQSIALTVNVRFSTDWPTEIMNKIVIPIVRKIIRKIVTMDSFHSLTVHLLVNTIISIYRP